MEENLKLTNDVYKRLNSVRVELQSKELSKSGLNKHAGFRYYELGDFIPEINKLNAEFGIISVFDINSESATLTIINVDNPNNTIIFGLNVVKAELRGSTAIQALGATNTYMKRYLYLNAYEIIEGDEIDAQKPQNTETTQITNTSTQTKPQSEKATPRDITVLKALAKKAGISDERMLEKYGKFIYGTPFMTIYNKAKSEIEEFLSKQAGK